MLLLGFLGLLGMVAVVPCVLFVGTVRSLFPLLGRLALSLFNFAIGVLLSLFDECDLDASWLVEQLVG